MVENDLESKVGNHPLGGGYHFKLGTRAIRKIEKELNRPFLEVAALLEAGSIDAAAVIVQHATVPPLTEDQADDALDEHGVKAFMKPLTDAIQNSGLFKGAIEVDGVATDAGKMPPAG